MKEYDVIIVGGGPGGYSTAVSAALSGLHTALVEKEFVGGTCVNWGCIPTKALLRYAKLRRSGQNVSYADAVDKSMKISRERREAIQNYIRNLGVEIFSDTGHVVSPTQVVLEHSGEVLAGRNIIVATGSVARRLPIAAYDESHIVTSREALSFTDPPKSVVVVGSGATGIELASVWNAFGSEVTVLEMMGNIMGTDDHELSEMAKAHFAKNGMTVKTDVTVDAISRTDDGVMVDYHDANGNYRIFAEKALVAAGIVPVSQNIGLAELGVEMVRGAIQVDDSMRTNIPGIYALGDVTGKLALAFTATLQGKCAIAAITGTEFTPIAYENIPRCIFSDMEAAYVGLNEKQAAAQGYEIAAQKAPIHSFNGHLIGAEQTVLKLVSDVKTGRVLGATIFGPDAADRIAGPTQMILRGATVDETIKAVCSGR